MVIASTTPTNAVMGLREWVLLLVLSFFWGGSFFFGQVALAELSPFSLVLGRVVVAAAALHLAVGLRGYTMPRTWAIWRRFAVMGAANSFIPFSLLFYGQTQIGSGLASILNATAPLWVVLLAHRFTDDEKLTVNRLVGVLGGLAGVVILIGPDLLRGLGSQALAQFAVIGAAISYACAGIYGKRFRGIPPLVTAAGQITSTAVMMLPVALLVDRPWLQPLPGAHTWFALLCLGLFSTALTVVLYFRLLELAGATNLLLATFLTPVSALLLATAFLGEQMLLRHMAGLMCIMFGLAAIDGRVLRRNWSQRS